MSLCATKLTLPLLAVLILAAAPQARAELFSLTASGTISLNSSADTTLPTGTPWTFEIIYDTAAPDLDFELLGAPDPTFGLYKNTGATPAITWFHYRAGNYEVTLDDSHDFGPGSEIRITFGALHAIDINLNDPGLFPNLAGSPVTFHADFNSSPTIFASDALPSNTTVGAPNFPETSVTLLPGSGGAVAGQTTSFAIAAVPEPSTATLCLGLLALLALRYRKSRPSRNATRTS